MVPRDCPRHSQCHPRICPLDPVVGRYVDQRSGCAYLTSAGNTPSQLKGEEARIQRFIQIELGVSAQYRSL